MLETQAGTPPARGFPYGLPAQATARGSLWASPKSSPTPSASVPSSAPLPARAPVSEFELRQLKAMSDEPNRDFTAVSRPPPRRTPQHLKPAYPARTGVDVAASRSV